MDATKDYYWLNEDSRKFLEKGYLEKGVTPEQRFRQIADNAERILIEGSLTNSRILEKDTSPFFSCHL